MRQFLFAVLLAGCGTLVSAAVPQAPRPPQCPPVRTFRATSACTCTNCPGESCVHAGDCGDKNCGLVRHVAGISETRSECSACSNGSCGVPILASVSSAPVVYYSLPAALPAYSYAPVSSCAGGACGMAYGISHGGGFCSSGCAGRGFFRRR
jgi:hypothetical protein